MWIVRLALRRPYTVAVMVLLILILGGLSLTRMPVDIFPNVDIPVVSVVWNYNGLPAEEMERRVVLLSERAYSSSVDGIERIESSSIPGIGLLRVYFHPGTEIGGAIAQIAAVSSTALRSMPPGMQPPVILRFNASNVPVAQLTVSSENIPEEKLFDYGLNFIRIRLFTIPGLSTPAPMGGKTREVVIDVDPAALAARGLSPADVVTSLQESNVILPAGTARIGHMEYNVLINASPARVSDFASIPLRVVGTAPVLLGDVAHVQDSYADQTNIVRVNGRRATYLVILKHADASTLAVVDATRDLLPRIKAAAPQGMELKIDFDQSVFVRAAVHGVLREGLIAAGLVSLMILVFLGSWRSTIIVCTSIPTAILVSIIGLNLLGQTMNLMTLGGLSLAIGMLVDDATVEVENIHRNLAQRKPLTVAILDGARQIAVPAIVATLSICIVFFPVVLLVGPARYLFTPLALSVVQAMLASYVLSRTLVPTLFRKLMRHHEHQDTDEGKKKGFAERFNAWRDRNFGRFQEAYGRLLDAALSQRAAVLVMVLVLIGVTGGLLLVVGTDFFPASDAGILRLHVRAPSGTRIEDTEGLFAKVEDRIRATIPAKELATINTNIGVPTSYNLAFVQSDNLTSMDGEIMVALTPKHKASADYAQRLRQQLPQEFPGATFYFQPADIVNQVLNFGLPSAIDVQIEHPSFEKALPIARRLRDAVASVPGAVDVHIAQILDAPSVNINVDRVRAAQLGVSERDVASSLLIALASSVLVSPSFYLNPENNVNYSVAVKEPLRLIDSFRSLTGLPITPGSGGLLRASDQATTLPALALPQQAPTGVLGNLASATPGVTPVSISHYTVQRVLDVDANVEGRDLGGVVSDIRAAIKKLGKLPDNMTITVRGQIEVMERSFRLLGLGLVLAASLVYLLMVVLFQSYLDPLIIMGAVPGALVGILWMLSVTGTTLNVESLMGSIMAVGIAVSNSILLVSFANEQRVEHPEMTATQAAAEAGRTRLRPVIMTALAMILGMIPMALGLGEGGDQNAPLGRAVIGGLLVTTLMTLFVVPVIYSLLRRGMPDLHVLEERFQREERGEDPDAPPDQPKEQKDQKEHKP